MQLLPMQKYADELWRAFTQVTIIELVVGASGAEEGKEVAHTADGTKPELQVQWDATCVDPPTWVGVN